MKRIYFLALLFVLVTVNINVAQITTETKFISKEDYRDKTLAMLIGMCGGFLSGYEYMNYWNTPTGYYEQGATLRLPKEPILGLPDDWFVYMGGTCGGSPRDEHHYGNWQLPNGDMNSDDDSHIDIFNQYLLNKYGLSISYQDIRHSWLYYQVSDFGGGQGAIEVLRDKQLIAPQCGQRDHGNSGHWLPEAYIEAETMGAAFPGMPFKASDMTDRFMRITGEGENVEWGKFWAATHAIAYFETDIRVVIEKALGVMPGNSRIRQMYDIVKALHAKYPHDWRAANYDLWHNTRHSNPMSVGFDGVMMLSDVNNGTGMLSILYGENDYDRTLRIVSLAGGDGDCTASSVCGILGIIKGMAGTPQPFKDRLYRNGQGRWINDVVHAFSMKANFPLSFTFDELTAMYQQNAEASIRAYNGVVSQSGYTIRTEKGNIPQIKTTNWGFEEGTLNGWKTWKAGGNANIWNERQCNDAGDGACAAATGQHKGTILTEGNAEAKLYQTVTGLKPGATYRIEGRMHTSGGREARFYVENYGGPYKYTSMKNGNTPFRYEYIDVTLGATNTSLDVGLHAVSTNNPGKWCNIDDIIIREIEHPAIPTRYEAELAKVNNVDINSNPSASGGKYIGGMFKTDSYVEFDNLEADYSGEYLMRLNYANAGAYAQQKVEVNGEFIGYVEIRETGDWGIFSQNIVTIPVTLKKGINTVRFSFYKEVAEIDYVDLVSPYPYGKKPSDGRELVSNGIYKIVSRNSGKVLSVDGNIENGANCVQKTFTGASNQYFKIVQNKGLYTISPIKSTQTVEVGSWKLENGDNINVYTNYANANQSWAIIEAEDGYYKILNQHSGKCIDVAGGSMNDGANVHQWEYLGGHNQQWKLEFIGTNDNDLPWAIPGKIEAEGYKNQSGVITKNSPEADGGQIVANIDNNDFTEYFISVTEAGKYEFSFRYTSATQGGDISIQIQNQEVARIHLKGTGGWNTWKNDSVVVDLPAGTYLLKCVYEGASALFDLNWFSVKHYTDCNGVRNGLANIDECGVCSGGNTGLQPCYVQQIYLTKGWNIISLYVQLADNSVSAIFNDAPVHIVKNDNAFWYKNLDAELNSLKNIVAARAYLVYMNEDYTLQVQGTKTEQIMPTSIIKEGWSLLGVPFDTERAISDYFNSQNCHTIKNFDGFWQPNGTHNSLHNFEPGKGYFIKQ